VKEMVARCENDSNAAITERHIRLAVGGMEIQSRINHALVAHSSTA